MNHARYISPRSGDKFGAGPAMGSGSTPPRTESPVPTTGPRERAPPPPIDPAVETIAYREVVMVEQQSRKHRIPRARPRLRQRRSSCC
jgi:hypothetical protein